MKIQIVGEHADSLIQLADRMGFERVAFDPEVMITHGGDGTFIGTERRYPGLLKLGIRDGRTCIKCPRHQDERVLSALMEGRLRISALQKLEARFGARRMVAMNDIILRNADARSAVRFRVRVDDQLVTEELIADGLVACTPFGSSAYFRSITRVIIHCGFGVAYNNCTEPPQHLVIAEDERLEVELTRGPADVVADNDPEIWRLEAGDRLVIRRAAEPARVLSVDTLRCPDCRYAHAPRRRY